MIINEDSLEYFFSEDVIENSFFLKLVAEKKYNTFNQCLSDWVDSSKFLLQVNLLPYFELKRGLIWIGERHGDQA